MARLQLTSAEYLGGGSSQENFAGSEQASDKVTTCHMCALPT